MSNARGTIAAIETAVSLCLSGQVRAVVTNPIAKSVLYQAGFGFPGHTEYLAHLAGDVDVAMMLRLQRERMEEGLVDSLDDYHRDYGLTATRLRRAAPDAVVMHPGPMNRGVEITDEVADGPRSLILTQVRNGVAARMAVLEALLGR